LDILFPPLTTPVRVVQPGMYSKILGLTWAYISSAVWPRNLFWLNSQASISTNKVFTQLITGPEFQELVQRSSEDSLAKSGESSTPTFHPIEADTFADYALPFIHDAVFGDSFALYFCI